MFSGANIASVLTQWITRFDLSLDATSHERRMVKLNVIQFIQTRFSAINGELDAILTLESTSQKSKKAIFSAYSKIHPERKEFIEALVSDHDFAIGYLVYTIFLLYILATLKILEATSELSLESAEINGKSKDLETKISALETTGSTRPFNKAQKDALSLASGVNAFVKEFLTKRLPFCGPLQDEKIAIDLYSDISALLLKYIPPVRNSGEPQAASETLDLLEKYRAAIINFLKRAIDKILLDYQDKFGIYAKRTWFLGRIFSPPSNLEIASATPEAILKPLIDILELLSKTYNLELANYNPNKLIGFSLGEMGLKNTKKLAITQLASKLKQLLSSNPPLPNDQLQEKVTYIINKIDREYGTSWREAGTFSKRVNEIIELLLVMVSTYSSKPTLSP